MLRRKSISLVVYFRLFAIYFIYTLLVRKTFFTGALLLVCKIESIQVELSTCVEMIVIKTEKRTFDGHMQTHVSSSNYITHASNVNGSYE